MKGFGHAVPSYHEPEAILMDEKKMSMFANAFLRLCEGLYEEHGKKLVGARVIVMDPEKPGMLDDGAEGQTA